MKLSTALVAVKKINSAVPRSNFSESELNRAAELILKAEGIINPLVIRRTSLESYEVVAGDFEYHVAARAREIDPRKGEMIGAFIIDAENEEVLLEQIKALRMRASESRGGEASSIEAQPPITSSSGDIQEIKNLLLQMGKSLEEKVDAISHKMEQSLRGMVEDAVKKQLEPEEISQPAPEREAEAVQTSKSAPATKPAAPNYARMTVTELKGIAKKRNLKGYSRMNKDELIALLEKS
jgi:Asp-tRNA(Asn)/Glu-tRNA(Gln) amidotransferase C subunit